MVADMLLPEGQQPAYLGHAVAMLIYGDFARFRFAKDKLQFKDAVLRYGETRPPMVRDPWGTFRFVRVGGATPGDDDVFSSLQDAPVFPSMLRKQQPVWPDSVPHGKLDERGMFQASRITAELDHPPGNWLVFERALQHTVGGHRRAGAGQRQRLVRRGASGPAYGGAYASRRMRSRQRASR